MFFKTRCCIRDFGLFYFLKTNLNLRVNGVFSSWPNQFLTILQWVGVVEDFFNKNHAEENNGDGSNGSKLHILN